MPYETLKQTVIDLYYQVQLYSNEVLLLQDAQEATTTDIQDMKDQLSGASDGTQMSLNLVRQQLIADHELLELKSNDILQLQQNDTQMQAQLNALVITSDTQQLQATLAALDLQADEIRFEVDAAKETIASHTTLLGALNNSLMGQDLNIQQLRADVDPILALPLNDVYNIAPIQDDVVALTNRVIALENQIIYLACPVGTIIIWHSNTFPGGYLHCNGQAFVATNYPILYQVLGTNVVPDLRGYFLRGLDTTGTVDVTAGTTRTLGSAQTDDNKGHKHFYADAVFAENDATVTTQTAYIGAAAVDYDNELVWRTATGLTSNPTTGANANQTSTTGANEARPKNKAVHYLIRAL